MGRTRNTAFRTLCMRAGLVLGGLCLACESEPFEPDVRVGAPPQTASVRGRVIEATELGLENPTGLAFSPTAGMMILSMQSLDTPSGAVTETDLVTKTENRPNLVRMGTGAVDPVNVAFDSRGNRLLVFQSEDNQLVEILTGPDGSPDPQTLRRVDARHFGIRNPGGVTVDPGNGRLFILDMAGPRIVQVQPHALLGFENPTVSEIDLAGTGLSNPRGVAFDPTTGHLHVLDLATKQLHELNETGQTVATRDLFGFGFRNPLGMSFGPSRDRTDDPSAMSLYITDSRMQSGAPAGSGLADNGQITELSFDVLPMPTSHTVSATLVATIATSQFSPPSPDAAGITYLGHLGNLLISDSEVNEMSIFEGVNLFEMTPSGTLVDTATTTSFSNEPTGITWNPTNNHLFISDDDADEIYEVNPGPDGLYGTADDVVTSFDTGVFGSGDPEGVTYDSWQDVLFIADGINNEVYRVSPGSNGVFDGVFPVGDDQVTSFDTGVLGLLDPEGIVFDSDFGHLYVSGLPNTSVFHLTTTGTLLRTIDVSAANATLLSGLGYVPASVNPAEMILWIVDRGVDNNSDPNENDGKAYKFSLPPFTGNAAPTVTITAPPGGSTHTQGNPIMFAGTATDPEDGDITASISWSSDLDGVIGSGGSFSTSTLSVGSHTVTASVTDAGGLPGSDAIAVNVTGTGGGGQVTLEGVVTGGSSSSATVSTGGPVTVTAGRVFVATVSAKSHKTLSGVSGLGGTWSHVATQCGGRSATGVAVFISTNATTTGVVTATMAGTASAAVISVAAYSGVNLASPIGAVNSANTNGVTGGCSGGSDTAVYSVPLTTTNPSSVVVGGVAVRNRTATPSAGWGNQVHLSQGSGGSVAGLAIFDQLIAAPSAITVDGTMNSSVDWAVIAIELIGGGGGSNEAPTATNVAITGTAQVGQQLSGNYTYDDADGDAEGVSTYRWLRNGTPIGGATAQNYTLVPADQGAQIIFEVTPVAATGASPGTAVPSAAVGPVAAGNAAPTATSVAITGTAEVGQQLSGTYTYSDAEGDAEGTSTFRWLRDGTPISGAIAQTYTLVAADQGALIRFEVTPVAATGTSPGVATPSAAFGPVVGPNSAPTASNVAITGIAQVGQQLSGTYTYFDADGDAEGTSTFRWLRDGTPISGATAQTYILVAADEGALIRFEVTPAAATGLSPGVAEQSAALGPIAPASGGGMGAMFEAVTTGGSTSSTTVSTGAPVPVTAGRVFVATVSAKSHQAVSGVSGLGGTWSHVATQCGGRSATGVAVFISTNATTTGVVTATMAGTASAAVISVAEYSGVNLATPIGAVNSANTNGVTGGCSGGSDTAVFSVPLTTINSSSVVAGGVALRNRTATPSAGWSDPVHVSQGSGGNIAGLAIFDQQIAAPSAITVDGTTNSSVDWAVIAIELIGGGGGGSNEAPTATNVAITGTAQVGQQLSGNYTYDDADGDAEGLSTYRWLRSGTPIGGATTQNYTLVAADQGEMIIFEVTPVAATGASPGTAVPSAAVGPVAAGNAAPTATSVAITGTAEVGQQLSGTYTYSDADGDAEGTSTFRWLRDGAPISGATSEDYTLVAADQDALIRFEVTPVALTGTSPGAAQQSGAFGPVVGPNRVPTANVMAITGTAQVGQQLTGNYAYNDLDGDAEGTSLYRWFRGAAPISGATTQNYTLVAADEGMMISFEVTPVAVAGASPGVAETSAAIGPVVPAGSGVMFEAVTTGGSTSSTTVSTGAPVPVTAGRVFLATVSAKSHESVSGVAGLGGTWSHVATQCGGRSATGVAVFISTNATTTGVVTATMAGTASAAVISVAEYSGVNLATPIGAVNSANTNGVTGGCSGGTDTAVFSVPLTTTNPSSMVVGGVALRNRTATPSAGWTDRVHVSQGSGGNIAGLAIFDQLIAAPSAITVDGTTNRGVDWAVIAIELVGN